MSNWYLDGKDYKNAIISWDKSYDYSKGALANDIHHISKEIENIFEHQYFKNYSNIFIEDIIWIASQVRINDSNDIHKCVHAFLHEVTKILDEEKGFQKHLNTIIGITISRIKKYIPNALPSIDSCLTDLEIIKIKGQLEEYRINDLLNEDAIDIDASKQMRLIERYIKAPNFLELSLKIENLLDIATSGSEDASLATASINYLLATDDVVNDDLGVLGLVDDMYAIDIGINNTRPKNLFNRLVNRHNDKYPSFDLPVIDSDGPLSLINIENIVKASYTKIDDEPLKRLLIVPDAGPIHVLSAMGKAICNRLDNSKGVIDDSILFNQGDKILIGEIPAVFHGNGYMKKVFVEYDRPSERAPNLHYIRTSVEGEKETISKDMLLNSSLCLDGSQGLSRRNDLKNLKSEQEKKYIPWGTTEFHENIKAVAAKKKIFIFCKKNNLDLYLNEKVFDVPIKSWFGVRYFNKDYKFHDHVSPHSLFPEPMFYSTSSKDIAMEMLRNRWDDKSVAREPDIIIIKEPTWLKDLEFLKLLGKSSYDILIANDFFRKSNDQLRRYGFVELAAKPETLFPIKETKNSINQSLIERFLLKSQSFKIISKIVDTSILDEIYTLMRGTIFWNDHQIFKWQLQNLLKKIRRRVIPHTFDSAQNLLIDFTKVLEEFAFLCHVNPEYSKLCILIAHNTEELLALNRSEAINDCIASIRPNEKTIIVVNRDQFKAAKKIFYDGSRNLDVAVPSDLDNLKDIENLIIPFFLGSEYSTKLRNFKYAKNHIFLLSKSEEVVHVLMQKRDKVLFNNLYSENNVSRKGFTKVSQSDIEMAVSEIDPASKIFQHSISIVSQQFQSSNEAENIDSRLFSLENDQSIILPNGGLALIVDSDSFSHSPKLNKVSSFAASDKLIIPKSFSGQDLLEAVLSSNQEKYAEYIKVNNRAKAWQAILKQFQMNNNLDSNGLHEALKKIGIKRDIATIRSWTNNPDTVAPRDREDIIPKIYSLEHTSHITKEACLKSISAIYQARAEAQKSLIANLEGKNIRDDQSSFEIYINEMRIEFQIMKIASVADVSVQFKYLYHLRSYDELNEFKL